MSTDGEELCGVEQARYGNSASPEEPLVEIVPGHHRRVLSKKETVFYLEYSRRGALCRVVWRMEKGVGRKGALCQ